MADSGGRREQDAPAENGTPGGRWGIGLLVAIVVLLLLLLSTFVPSSDGGVISRTARPLPDPGTDFRISAVSAR